MLTTLVSLLAVLDASLSLVEAQTTYSTGQWMQYGQFSPELQWQSSGVLSSSCDRRALINNCYKISLGGYNTNLQSTTKAQYQASLGNSSSLRTLASSSSSSSAEPTTQEGWAALAAQDDENVYAYYQAFPPASNSLVRRQVACPPPPPPDPNQPPSPPSTPSARQRVELLSWPGAAAGTTWKYTWRTNHQKTSIGVNFNHIWQVFRRDNCGGPLMTLDLKNDQAVLIDLVRSCPNNNCASTPISNWWGVTIQHTMTIRFGIRGSINYTAAPVNRTAVGKPLLSYSARGDMGADASIKTGTYRLNAQGLQPSVAFVGDWTATRIS